MTFTALFHNHRFKEFGEVLSIMSRLFLGNSEIDDLHLVSRRHTRTLIIEQKSVSPWPADSICGLMAPRNFVHMSMVPFLREVHRVRPLLRKAIRAGTCPLLSPYYTNSLWMWCMYLIKSCCSISPLFPAINCRFAGIAILDLVTLSKQFNTI